MFRVTHPFHPLTGRELLLVTCRRNWGEQRVYFYNDDGRLVSVPLLWTTLAAVDPFVELAGGRSAFRIGDLLELAHLLAALEGGVAGSRPRDCQRDYAVSVNQNMPGRHLGLEVIL